MEFALLCAVGSVFVLAFLFVMISIRIVPPDKRLSVHRLGRYLGERGPGIVILIPFIDRGVLKPWDGGKPDQNRAAE